MSSLELGKEKGQKRIKKRNSYNCHMEASQKWLQRKRKKRKEETIVKCTHQNATSWNKCFGRMLMLPVFWKFITFCHQVDDHYVINDCFLCHFFIYILPLLRFGAPCIWIILFLTWLERFFERWTKKKKKRLCIEWKKIHIYESHDYPKNV